MEIRTTVHFNKNLAKKIKKNPQLKNTFKKQVNLLKENLRHQSLKLHKSFISMKAEELKNIHSGLKET